MSRNEDVAGFLAGLMNKEPELEETKEKTKETPPAPKPVETKTKPVEKPPEKKTQRKRAARASTPKKKLLSPDMVYSFICEQESTGKTGWSVLRRVIERNSTKKQIKKDIALLMAIIEIKRHFESNL